jgi:Flp pilus assembly protein TadB
MKWPTKQPTRQPKPTNAVVITSAPISPEHEFSQRRRRYAVLMSLRIVCLLAAVLTYGFSLWFALALVVGGAVLPWCAVLIANDGPARKRVVRPVPVAPEVLPQLPGSPHDRTVDG